MKTLALITIALSLIASNYIELVKITAIQQCIEGKNDGRKEIHTRTTKGI